MSKRDVIRQIQSERAISTDTLSKLSGVPRATLYRYFRGADIRGSAVEAIEGALGILPPAPDSLPSDPPAAA